MKKINEEILYFRNFLNSCWAFVQKFYNKDEIINENLNDWFQANWEILIEREICQPGNFLEIYGDGAEIYESYSRVTYYDKLPTHSVVIRAKERDAYDYYSKTKVAITENQYVFKLFVQFKDDNFLLCPPFEFVESENIKDDQIYCFKLTEIDFYVVEIDKSQQ